MDPIRAGRRSVSEKVYIALLALPAATLLILALFTFPSSDDFCFQHKVVTLGFAGAQLDWYMTWSGRYTASALISWLMLGGSSWYPLASLLVLLAWFASLWALLASVAGGSVAHRDVLIAATTVFVAYGAFAPSPYEGFYWASGALTYQVGGVLLLLMLAVNIRHARAGAQGNVVVGLLLLANLVLGLVLAGTNETVTLFAMMLFAAGAIVARRTSFRAALPWLAGLLAVAIGLVVVSLAPGNEARLQYFPEGWRFFVAVSRTAVHTLGFIVRESANPALWLGAALLAAPLWGSLSDGTRDWLIRRRGWLALVAFWVAMIAACYFPANYVLGAGPPRRAVNIAFLILVLGWIPVVTVLAERFWSGRHFFVPSSRTRSLLLLLLGLTLVGAPQMREMYKDLGHGAGFRKELLQREQTIRGAAAQGIAHVEVAPLKNRPEHLHAHDIERDPGNFKNQCLAAVFGLKTIRIQDAPPGR